LGGNEPRREENETPKSKVVQPKTQNILVTIFLSRRHKNEKIWGSRLKNYSCRCKKRSGKQK